jgi:hypothetical protein
MANQYSTFEELQTLPFEKAQKTPTLSCVFEYSVGLYWIREILRMLFNFLRHF